MKKFAFALLFILALALPASAAGKVEVVVSGDILEADADAEIVNGRTFVPLRAIAEKLGAEVGWHQETQGITLSKGGAETELGIGALTAYVNGREVALEAAPYIKDERTFVPLRFIAQSLGGRAVWCDDIRTAVIIPAYSGPSGETDAELLESYFTTVLPKAIKDDNKALAKAVGENPEELANYFANLWEDMAVDYLSSHITEAELTDYRSLPNNDEKRFAFLEELAEKRGLSLLCPIKLCPVENNGSAAVILDSLAPRTAMLVTQYLLTNVDGALVANPL